MALQIGTFDRKKWYRWELICNRKGEQLNLIVNRIHFNAYAFLRTKREASFIIIIITTIIIIVIIMVHDPTCRLFFLKRLQKPPEDETIRSISTHREVMIFLQKLKLFLLFVSIELPILLILVLVVWVWTWNLFMQKLKPRTNICRLLPNYFIVTKNWQEKELWSFRPIVNRNGRRVQDKVKCL